MHVITIDGSAFDLLHTLGKSHALGMTVRQVMAAATPHRCARSAGRNSAR